MAAPLCCRPCYLEALNWTFLTQDCCIAGANAVYRSPTPSVPVLPLAPAPQPATAREKPATYVGETISLEQPASAPVTSRESSFEADAFASPSSHAVRPPSQFHELRAAHACSSLFAWDDTSMQMVAMMLQAALVCNF